MFYTTIFGGALTLLATLAVMAQAGFLAKQVWLNENEQYQVIPGVLNATEVGELSFAAAKFLPIIIMRSSETFKSVNITASNILDFIDVNVTVKSAASDAELSNQ